MWVDDTINLFIIYLYLWPSGILRFAIPKGLWTHLIVLFQSVHHGSPGGQRAHGSDRDCYHGNGPEEALTIQRGGVDVGGCEGGSGAAQRNGGPGHCGRNGVDSLSRELLSRDGDMRGYRDSSDVGHRALRLDRRHCCCGPLLTVCRSWGKINKYIEEIKKWHKDCVLGELLFPKIKSTYTLQFNTLVFCPSLNTSVYNRGENKQTV